MKKQTSVIFKARPVQTKRTPLEKNTRVNKLSKNNPLKEASTPINSPSSEVPLILQDQDDDNTPIKSTENKRKSDELVRTKLNTNTKRT